MPYLQPFAPPPNYTPTPEPAPMAPPATMPMAPPQFGGTMAPPLAQSLTPPQMPGLPPPQGGAPPNMLQNIMPIIASIVAGKRDPAAIGAGLAAYTQGKRLKQAEKEQQHERDAREQRERAEFYTRMITNAQQFDDPVAFEQWKSAIKPMADVYGVPMEAVVFSDAKKTASEAKKIQAGLDQAVKLHGPEILNRPDVSLQLPDGRTVKISDALRIVGQVTAGGQAVPVKTATDKPNPVDAGSFEDYTIRYAKGKGKTVEQLTAADIEDARKRYQQSDDRPRVTVNTGAADARTNARIDRLSAAFSAHPLVKEYNEVQAQQAIIQRVVNGGWSGPGDMAAVFAFMKALDPNSVVRETEYDNAAKSGNIFAGWAAKFNGALNPSGGFLSDQVRKDFLKTIDSRMSVKGGQYQNLRKQMVARVDRIKAGAPETGDEAIIDYSTGVETPEAGKPVGRFNPATGKVEAIK
jgi:hypothetical protein